MSDIYYNQDQSPNFDNQKKTTSLFGVFWDIFCVSSIVGIWPRFIEPKLITTTKFALPIADLPQELSNLKILQFSDLHIHENTSETYLHKLSKKISSLKPDIIVFTGDFLCYSYVPEPKRLQTFLCSLRAPHGCFAILGNHDYAACVSISESGNYDVVHSPSSSLLRAFKRLGTTTSLTKIVTHEAQNVVLHAKLVKLLEKTPFKLLHNNTHQVRIGQAALNICGLGEYMLGRAQPEEAFKNYDRTSPGLILLHNPDGIKLLHGFPGDIILSGHTHGGQVNLPWMWRKFTLLENMKLKKGLLKIADKKIYINRGIGSVLPFRWFSPPELTLITLEQAI